MSVRFEHNHSRGVHCFSPFHISPTGPGRTAHGLPTESDHLLKDHYGAHCLESRHHLTRRKQGHDAVGSRVESRSWRVRWTQFEQCQNFAEDHSSLAQMRWALDLRAGRRVAKGGEGARLRLTRSTVVLAMMCPTLRLRPLKKAARSEHYEEQTSITFLDGKWDLFGNRAAEKRRERPHCLSY